MTYHLRQRILRLLLSTQPRPPASPAFYPPRFLSTAASVSPGPSAVEEYLVATCGLSRAQALKASKNLPRVRFPSRADAVLAFLSSLGLTSAEIATVVAGDPCVLRASVERTLAPRVDELSRLGLSRVQIARFIHVADVSFRRCALQRTVSFWLPVFGSFDKFLQAIKMNRDIFTVSIENVAKPNLAFLQQCGTSGREIIGLNLYSSRLLTLNPKSLREAVERVDELGIERSSRMFRWALSVVAFTSKEDISRKMGLIQKIGFSHDDVSVLVKKAPQLLQLREEKVQRAMHFLTKEVGIMAPYIAQRPALLMYSLERRLLPRHILLKVLRERGLLNVEFDFYFIAMLGEETFVQRFVHPYKDRVPGLADDYASRCSGSLKDHL